MNERMHTHKINRIDEGIRSRRDQTTNVRITTRTKTLMREVSGPEVAAQALG
jgi:hypothetical protein